MTKRIFDIFFSLLAILLFLPVFLLTAVCIFGEDGHPILFRQSRVGLRRKQITVYKFRSMRNNRITGTGTVIRKFGLDELPQFFNVLKGDMSIVGPRPLTRHDIDRLGWNGRDYLKRWEIKPGITGPAQLCGGKGQTHSWKLDQYYLANNNLMLDFKIIVISFLVNIFGKHRIQRALQAWNLSLL